MKTADWIIEIGPEAGEAGGRIVAEGPPEVVAKVKGSHTAAFLWPVLEAGPHAERPRFDPDAAALRRARRRPAAQKALQALGGAEADARMPWEIDGRRWHLQDRVTRTGKTPRWSSDLLRTVIERVEALGRTAWRPPTGRTAHS